MPTGATAAPVPVATKVPTAAPIKCGGTIRLGNGFDGPDLNPGNSNLMNWIWCQNVHDSLQHWTDAGTLTPGLAEKLDISPDGASYTYYLRRDAKFSNGRGITAHDVVWSWKYVLDPKNAFAMAYNLYPIKGAQAYNSGKGSVDDVQVKAADDFTLAVTLEAPSALARFLLAGSGAAVIAKENVEQLGADWAKSEKMITSGPFIVTKLNVVNAADAVLEPNSNYYGPKPKAAKIVATRFSGGTGETAAFEAGELEIASVATVDLKRIKADPQLSKMLVVYPRSSTQLCIVGFRRPENPLLKDKRLRQAVGWALDRQAIVDTIAGGVGTPANCLVPNTISGYVKDEGFVKYDPDKAKALLKEAGFEGGQGVGEIEALTAPGNVPLWTLIADQLKKVGLTLKVTSLEASVYMQRFQKGDFDLAYSLYSIDYPDGASFLVENWGPGGPNYNRSGWRNEQYLALVEQIRFTTDDAKRRQLEEQAQRIMLDDVPNIPVFYPQGLALVQPYVQGHKPHPMTIGNNGGMFYLADLCSTKL